MSTKLDRSLDEIMQEGRPAAGRGGRKFNNRPQRKAASKAKAATTAIIAPVGGIQKKGHAKAAMNTKLASALLGAGESKVAVSNLPKDATEDMIKDFFVETVGSAKRAILNYDPNGRSRGTATVVFHTAKLAAAAVALDGVPVDNKPIRIESLVAANAVAKTLPVKTLQQRMGKPKVAAQDKPKPVNKSGAKVATNGDATGAKGGRGRNNTNKGKKSGRVGKPKAKTAEELDAEMQDYFQPGTNGTAQPTGGDAMDEVL